MPIPEREIVIIGGGIIGCTTAYYLTRHPLYDASKHKITLLEVSKIAGGASGKAAGLLALWAYPESIAPLSFCLHAVLAKEHNGESRWGYRRVSCGQVTAEARTRTLLGGEDGGLEHIPLQKGSRGVTGMPEDLDWLAAGRVKYYLERGDPSTTAQLHPYEFTTSMAELAQEKGVKIVFGMVTGVDHSNGLVRSVTYNDKTTSTAHTISATDVIVSAGPWTPSIFPWVPVSATRAHSVTIRPSRPVSAYALFAEITLLADFGNSKEGTKSKKHQLKPVTLEIYARPNNEVYVCGEEDTLVQLPKTSEDVAADLARCQDIIDHVASISDKRATFPMWTLLQAVGRWLVRPASRVSCWQLGTTIGAFRTDREQGS